MTAQVDDAARPRPMEQRKLDTDVELVIPVYNEEADLARSVARLDEYLRTELPYSYCITIADNASTDSTWAIARQLADQRPTVRVLHVDQKGRGRALKAAWSASTAAVIGYMDVDLSTDLRAVLPLLAPLLSNHSDLAIGTRLSHGSRIVRGPKREVISRCYNLLLRGCLSTSFSDAQCGFKALRRDVAERLLPAVEDNNWFFDTELLVLAERSGLRIHEVPVDWIDDPDSRVDIVATAMQDLRGIARLARGQVISFALVGVLSTLSYLLIYLVLRLAVDAQVANLAALVITAIANTAINRRLTFGVRGSGGLIKHHVGGLLAFGIGLGLTSGSLWLLHGAEPDVGRSTEVAVLVIANAVSTMIRFFALRRVMRHPLVRPVPCSAATAWQRHQDFDDQRRPS